jgi:hypothetical protein
MATAWLGLKLGLHLYPRYATWQRVMLHGEMMDIQSLIIGAASVTTIDGALRSTAWLNKRLQQWRDDHNELLALRKLIIGDYATRSRRTASAAYRNDNVHDLFPTGGPSPDNLLALTAIVGKRYSEALQQGKLTVEQSNFLQTDTSRDLVLVGSPTSEGLSRCVFGYEEEEDGSLLWQGGTLDLPFHWDLHRDPEAPVVKRYVEGALLERQNWFLRGYEGTKARLLVPSSDSDTGLLQRDYLLITRLRNFIEDYRNGHYLTSVGGTHGIGTRAVPLVLRSKTLASQLTDAIGISPGSFQAVVEVSVEHDHNKNVSKPTDVNLIYATSLPDDDEIWGHARLQFLRAWGSS